MSDSTSWKLIDDKPRPCKKCGRERNYMERELPGKPGDTSWELGACECGEPADRGDKRGGPRVDTGGRMGPAR